MGKNFNRFHKSQRLCSPVESRRHLNRDSMNTSKPCQTNIDQETNCGIPGMYLERSTGAYFVIPKNGPMRDKFLGKIQLEQIKALNSRAKSQARKLSPFYSKLLDRFSVGSLDHFSIPKYGVRERLTGLRTVHELHCSSSIQDVAIEPSSREAIVAVGEYNLALERICYSIGTPPVVERLNFERLEHEVTNLKCFTYHEDTYYVLMASPISPRNNMLLGFGPTDPEKSLVQAVVFHLEGFQNIFACCYVPLKRSIAYCTGEQNKTLALFDIRTSKVDKYPLNCSRGQRLNSNTVRALEVGAEDDSSVLYVAAGNTIILRDVRTREQESVVLECNALGRIDRLCVLKRWGLDCEMVVGTAVNECVVVDWRCRKVARHFDTIRTNKIVSPSLQVDESVDVVCYTGGDSTTHFWDVRTGVPLGVWELPEYRKTVFGYGSAMGVMVVHQDKIDVLM